MARSALWEIPLISKPTFSGRKSIENIFDNEAPKVQCLIACLHLGDYLRGYGDEIFEQMKKDKSYNISLFFSKLFTAVLPAGFSTSYMRYQKLKQDELTITEFSKTLKLLCGVMGFDMETQKYKFIFGLHDKEIRKVLLRVGLEGYTFKGVVQ